ncbi:cell division protein SepF [Kurthia huakuii]|uniref:cell division protein SepF n=1 Tax=Kurthia huakuii TaxID=1421019 RepID=UPI000496C95A|nr:cell division protein SepF [Kurthia huakuii]MBM7698405.1 cell division inhibitor SepF [Kurthia huakuii]
MKNFFKDFFYLDNRDDEFEEEVAQQQPKQQAKPQPQQRPQQVQQLHQPAQQQMATPRKIQQPTQRKTQQVASNMPPQQVAQMQVVEKKANNVVSMNRTTKVNLFEPRMYSEAQNIADCIRNKKSAVVNLQRIDKENGKRIIDFLSGTVFALDGEIKKIGIDIFLCTPDNVEIDGAISEYYYEEDQY